MSKVWYNRTVVGSIFTVIFLGIGIFLCNILTISQMTCQRTEGTCSFQKRHIWETDFKTTNIVPISDIQYAEVFSKRVKHSGGNTRTTSTVYQVRLKLKDGWQNLFDSWSSNDFRKGKLEHDGYAEQINLFIQGRGDKLIITESGWIFLLPIGFLFFSGLMCVAVWRNKKRKR